MRPRLQIARERLAVVLSRQGPMTAAELATALEVSGPTVLRMLREEAASVLAAGQARRRRYAWLRPLKGRAATLNLYAVGHDGRAQAQAPLSLIAPQGSHLMLDAAVWPVPDESLDGWWRSEEHTSELQSRENLVCRL